MTTEEAGKENEAEVEEEKVEEEKKGKQDKMKTWLWGSQWLTTKFK